LPVVVFEAQAGLAMHMGRCWAIKRLWSNT
jgi:hypothetical protein